MIESMSFSTKGRQAAGGEGMWGRAPFPNRWAILGDMKAASVYLRWRGF
jgi:hypothetical protein